MGFLGTAGRPICFCRTARSSVDSSPVSLARFKRASSIITSLKCSARSSLMSCSDKVSACLTSAQLAAWLFVICPATKPLLARSAILATASSASRATVSLYNSSALPVPCPLFLFLILLSINILCLLQPPPSLCFFTPSFLTPSTQLVGGEGSGSDQGVMPFKCRWGLFFDFAEIKNFFVNDSHKRFSSSGELMTN